MKVLRNSPFGIKNNNRLLDKAERFSRQLKAKNAYRRETLNSTKKKAKSRGQKSLSVQRYGAVENVLVKKSVLRCLKCPAERSLSNLNCPYGGRNYEEVVNGHILYFKFRMQNHRVSERRKQI